MGKDLRITDGVTRGPGIEFLLDGEKVAAFLGETVAAALMARGDRVLRRTGVGDDPRGYYCGMGICWECAVSVEGVGVVQACRLPAAPGLRVSRLSVAARS